MSINDGIYKLELVDEDSPERCIHLNKLGKQCLYRKMPGFDTCKKHSHNYAKLQKNYRLEQWQNRVSEFSESSELKSLKEEIGILRLVLESILVQCKDAHDLMLYSSKIADHVTKIEKVVASCHRLELSTSMLLDKTLVLQLANVMIEIIGNHIDDSNVLERISSEIVETIIKTSRLDVPE